MIRTVEERQRRLLALVEEHREADIATMTRRLQVSEATLRRDLATLERGGYLARTFGGAKALPQPSLVVRTFGDKRERMRPEKERIARHAASMVEPGMAVALDSGTTIWRVAAALRGRGSLRIVTSALAGVEELGCEPGVSVRLIGGQFRPENLDFVGPDTIVGYQQVRADIAFIGVDALIPGKGVYSVDEQSASVAAAIAGCAERVVVAMDHTKVHARGYRQILPMARIDTLITDSGVSAEHRQELQRESFKLMVVD